jgi:hypothetical protein
MEILERLTAVETVEESQEITKPEITMDTNLYAKLGSHRLTKYPFNCRPDKMIVIDDIHPVDPKYNQKADFIGQPFILKTAGVMSMVRTENRNVVGKQRSFASVPVKPVFSDSPIIYFYAVNFHLAKKEEEKDAKDLRSDS